MAYSQRRFWHCGRVMCWSGTDGRNNGYECQECGNIYREVDGELVFVCGPE